MDSSVADGVQSVIRERWKLRHQPTYWNPGTGVPFRFDGEGVGLGNQALCVQATSKYR
jgi:hypothetical protein